MRILTPFVILASSFLLLWMAKTAITDSFQTGTRGAVDFVEYWTAWRVAASGGNPYDADQMIEAQRDLRGEVTSPLMMWNPPWALTILKPILTSSFQQSARWMWIINCSLIIISLLLLANLYGVSRSERIFLFSSGLLYYPLWSCLRYGQISLIVLGGTVLVLWGMERRAHSLSALGLVFISIKPHVTYLMLVLLLLHWIRGRNLKFLAWTIILFAGLVATHWNQLVNWAHALIIVNSENYPVPSNWIVATLVGRIRLLLYSSSGTPLWPSVIIPGMSSIILTAYAIVRWPSFNWPLLVPSILAISYLTAPYGWIFDQAILLITYMATAHNSFVINKTGDRRGLVIIILLLALQLFSMLLTTLWASRHHELFWLPIPLLILLHLSQLLNPSPTSGTSLLERRCYS